MINFTLNGDTIKYDGDTGITLLEYLREEKHLTAAKDGCSGEATCGACMVEINGQAKLSCNTTMDKLDDAVITTLEGFPEDVKKILGQAFVVKGAVQCGFCTPGFLMRTKILLQNKPQPTRDEIKKALTLNLCRCTGYVKIIDAIELAAKSLYEHKKIEIPKTDGKVGNALGKYLAYETAIGERPFVNDIFMEGMLHAALHFSKHPRARVLKIDTSEAEKLEGVVRIFTAGDVPGRINIGLIQQDWPLMIAKGAITNYIGDVIAGVVAKTRSIARKAANLIKVDYEILEPVTDVFKALEPESPILHGNSNELENCKLKLGDYEKALKESIYIASGTFHTQRIEHAFLEVEAAIAMPHHEDGLKLLSQGQGIYVDRRQIAVLLGIPEEKVNVVLVPNGGGFGGKEDLSVQGHVSLYAWLLKRPVKLALSRQESIRMHPKRHPVIMDMTLACDEKGKFSVMKLSAFGDTGAYASVGTKVMERVAGHATGGYFVPVIDLEARTIYTNNVPAGAMRGFGANQVAFALETLVDELCEKGNFDRWQIRYNNALEAGLSTATGQVLKGGVAIKECLLALKPYYEKAKYKGLACAIKNCGVGNGMADFSDVLISIEDNEKVNIWHGWTEMGQGVNNMAIQALCEETGINPENVDVFIDTKANIETGMTTSSRATTLLCHAIIDACKLLKKDLQTCTLKELKGRQYKGHWICDWTTKPGKTPEGKENITHYAYGYAAQMVELDENGSIKTVYAAHDAGRIMNPVLFEGQIEGAIHMGLGYALSENLPMKDGYLVSDKLKDCKILRAKDMPDIKVIGIEKADPVGPYGAKGIGEIGLIPTAAAVATAKYDFNKKRQYRLPLI
ncbi:MAG: selenium-dependent xanthine dehydrogenase [Bacteroidales bacterium]|nr:selenium-dependent xanthine dehydrogenase [Bacteroidales bacterium]